MDFAVEGVLIQQLAAGDTIELGARLGDSVLVGALDFGLMGEIDPEN